MESLCHDKRSKEVGHVLHPNLTFDLHIEIFLSPRPVAVLRFAAS